MCHYVFYIWYFHYFLNIQCIQFILLKKVSPIWKTFWRQNTIAPWHLPSQIEKKPELLKTSVNDWFLSYFLFTLGQKPTWSLSHIITALEILFVCLFSLVLKKKKRCSHTHGWPFSGSLGDFGNPVHGRCDTHSHTQLRASDYVDVNSSITRGLFFPFPSSSCTLITSRIFFEIQHLYLTLFLSSLWPQSSPPQPPTRTR